MRGSGMWIRGVAVLAFAILCILQWSPRVKSPRLRVSVSNRSAPKLLSRLGHRGNRLRTPRQPRVQQVASGSEKKAMRPGDFMTRDGRILKRPVHMNVSDLRRKIVKNFGGSTGIESYMRLPVEQYMLLNESMMERSDHDPNTFVLSVPKIRILSVWIQPEIQVSVTTLEDRVLLQGTNCRIDGSDIIMRMGLNNRFDMDALTEMRWNTTGEQAEVELKGSLNVWCEKLPPFHIMPTRVLQGASNAVLGAMYRTLSRIFLNSLMKDYEKWANDADYRALRAQRSKLSPSSE